MPLRIFETGSLLGVALKAATSIKASPRVGGQEAALVSIVFSVVALEGFINEATELAQESSRFPPDLEPRAIVVFAECMADAEGSKASLESKFILAKWILSGEQFDRGAQPYQDFFLLMRLRNELVHFKPNGAFEQDATAEEIHQDLFNKFRGKKILAENTKSSGGSWTFLIETKAVAEWACNTAARMVLDFCSKIPPKSTLKATMSDFERAFAPENLFRTAK